MVDDIPSRSPADPSGLAREAFRRGDMAAAAQSAEQWVRQQPEQAEAHQLLGRAALALQAPARAAEALQRAVELGAADAGCLTDLARALLMARRPGEALEAANRAAATQPADPMLLSTLGLIYNQCHAAERASAVFRKAAALAPDHPVCRLNFATALTFDGRIDEAEAELEACIRIAPLCWPAHALLSRLRRQTAGRNHVDTLRGLLGQAAHLPAALAQVHMALGKEYEDLGDYPAAFAQFLAGKAAGARIRRHAWQQDEALFRGLAGHFAGPAAGRGYASDEPIFVVGMPRSGTTLVERILSSHPHVHAAGELDQLAHAVEALGALQRPFALDPEAPARTAELDWAALGERYVAGTRPATSMKPRFVDKLPHNFLFAGHIARALPNARIVCLRRNPLDTCLGNLREPFTEHSPYHGYSFDLDHIARYYVLFDRLLAHWKRAFPGHIHEIAYEALVDDPAPVARELLGFCGLPWDPRCLQVEANAAAATTASTLQVRAPIHRGAVGRWRHYAGQMAPVRRRLEDAGIDCG